MHLAELRVTKSQSIACHQCRHLMLPGDFGVYFNDGAVVHIRCYVVGSTTDEGQVTVHMDRNSLLFGGKPMIQFIRDAVVGVVEFDIDAKVVHLRTY